MYDPLADAVAMSSASRQLPPLQQTGSHLRRPKPRRGRSFNPGPFIIGGIVVVGIVVLGFVGIAAWKGVSNAIASSKELNWTYHDAGPYTINFPFEPERHDTRVASVGWKASRGRLMACAIHVPIPAEEQSGAGWEKELLGRLKEKAYVPKGGVLVSSQDIDFHGYTGKSSVHDVSIKGTPMKIYSRVYIVRGTMYELTWVVPADDQRQEQMTKFFDSFVVKGVNDKEAVASSEMTEEKRGPSAVGQAASAVGDALTPDLNTPTGVYKRSLYLAEQERFEDLYDLYPRDTRAFFDSHAAAEGYENGREYFGAVRAKMGKRFNYVCANPQFKEDYSGNRCTLTVIRNDAAVFLSIQVGFVREGAFWKFNVGDPRNILEFAKRLEEIAAKEKRRQPEEPRRGR